MAVQMWMRDDIYNVLMGLEMTSAQQAGLTADARSQAYRQGFRAALIATAASFGISPRTFGPDGSTARPWVTVSESGEIER